jgi:hypothetical protein
VEAVRYSGIQVVKTKKAKRTRSVNPFTMTIANATRSKRKLLVVALSMSVSLILLNGVSGVSGAANGFDAEKYLSNTCPIRSRAQAMWEWPR